MKGTAPSLPIKEEDDVAGEAETEEGGIDDDDTGLPEEGEAAAAVLPREKGHHATIL